MIGGWTEILHQNSEQQLEVNLFFMVEKTAQLNDQEKNITRLKEKVLATAPILRKTREQKGKQSLYEHAAGYAKISSSNFFIERKKEFIASVAQYADQLLGEAVGKSVAAQLDKHYFVSTADHHGPICHPFSLSANIIAAAPYIGVNSSTIENNIVLSCANISLNNSSFPRGLLFHSLADGLVRLRQISFFPAKERARPVYGLRPFTQIDLKHTKQMLRDMMLRNEVQEAEVAQIVSVLDTIYADPAVLQADSFAQQISKTNYRLWPRLFGGATVPNLIYLDQETIVKNLLINFHLDQKTIITDVLLDQSYQKSIIHYFDEIIGAFSSKKQIGTFLFWALPKGCKYRTRLWPQAKELVSIDESFRVPLSASAITEKLQSGELIPSTLLTFLVVSFYYGVTALGGFSQPSYLTYMKEAYMRFLQSVGRNDEARICQDVQTDIMGGDMALALLQNKAGNIEQATGLDLLLCTHKKLVERMMQTAKTMTFEQATDIMMPMFYEVMFSDLEREEQLSQVTSGQIAALNGVRKDIKPCIFI